MMGEPDLDRPAWTRTVNGAFCPRCGEHIDEDCNRSCGCCGYPDEPADDECYTEDRPHA